VKDDLGKLLRNNFEAFLRKAYQEEHGTPLGDDPYITHFCDGLSWLEKTGGRTLHAMVKPTSEWFSGFHGFWPVNRG
jgi:hypothetical protein